MDSALISQTNQHLKQTYPSGLVLVLCWVAYKILSDTPNVLQFIYVRIANSYPQLHYPLFTTGIFLEIGAFIVAIFLFISLFKFKKTSLTITTIWSILVVTSAIRTLSAWESYGLVAKFAGIPLIVIPIIYIIMGIITWWYIHAHKSLFTK